GAEAVPARPRVGTEAAWLIALLPPRREEPPVGREHLDAAANPFGRVEPALAVAGEEVWPTEAGMGRRTSAELSGLRPVASPGRVELAVEREPLDPVVLLIGDVEAAIRRQHDPSGAVQLARPGAAAAELAHEAAVVTVERDPVLPHEGHVDAVDI